MTGEGALACVQAQEQATARRGGALKAPAGRARQRDRAAAWTGKTRGEGLGALKAKLASSRGRRPRRQAVDVKGAKVVAATLDGADVKALRETDGQAEGQAEERGHRARQRDGRQGHADRRRHRRPASARSRPASWSTSSRSRSAARAAVGPTWRRRAAPTRRHCRRRSNPSRLGGASGYDSARRDAVSVRCTAIRQRQQRRHLPGGVAGAGRRQRRPLGRLWRRSRGRARRRTRCARHSTPTPPVFFVFNGTAANSLALAAICRNTDAVVCHAFAHVNVDECGAPEFFSGGAKLLTVDTPDAKLTCEAISSRAAISHGEHASRPRAVTLTQATELGAIYAPDELRALTAHSHALGLKVHMDGARFANAVAALRLRAGGHCAARRHRRAVAGAARRTDCRSARRSCSSITRWPTNSRADASRAVSSRRRCGSSRRHGRRCCEMARGCGMRSHANAMARRMAAALAKVPGARFISPNGGQRRVRASAAAGDSRPATPRLALLRVRRGDRLPVHVRVGYARRGGRPIL